MSINKFSVTLHGVDNHDVTYSFPLTTNNFLEKDKFADFVEKLEEQYDACLDHGGDDCVYELDVVDYDTELNNSALHGLVKSITVAIRDKFQLGAEIMDSSTDYE